MVTSWLWRILSGDALSAIFFKSHLLCCTHNKLLYPQRVTVPTAQYPQHSTHNKRGDFGETTHSHLFLFETTHSHLFLFETTHSHLFLVCRAYCATSKGSLNWFEVDFMCSPSLLIQSDLCIVYFYHLSAHRNRQHRRSYNSQQSRFRDCRRKRDGWELQLLLCCLLQLSLVLSISMISQLQFSTLKIIKSSQLWSIPNP